MSFAPTPIPSNRPHAAFEHRRKLTFQCFHSPCTLCNHQPMIFSHHTPLTRNYGITGHRCTSPTHIVFQTASARRNVSGPPQATWTGRRVAFSSILFQPRRGRNHSAHPERTVGAVSRDVNNLYYFILCCSVATANSFQMENNIGGWC